MKYFLSDIGKAKKYFRNVMEKFLIIHFITFIMDSLCVYKQPFDRDNYFHFTSLILMIKFSCFKNIYYCFLSC